VCQGLNCHDWNPIVLLVKTSPLKIEHQKSTEAIQALMVQDRAYFAAAHNPPTSREALSFAEPLSILKGKVNPGTQNKRVSPGHPASMAALRLTMPHMIRNMADKRPWHPVLRAALNKLKAATREGEGTRRPCFGSGARWERRTAVRLYNTRSASEAYLRLDRFS